MKYPHCIFLLTFFSLQHTFAQYDASKISAPTRKITNTLTTAQRIIIGNTEASAITNSFYNLKNRPSSEIIELCNHPNAIVSCYAFLAICMNGDKDIDYLKIAKSKLGDTTPIVVTVACISTTVPKEAWYFYLLEPRNFFHNNQLLNESSLSAYKKIAGKLNLKPIYSLVGKLKQ